MDRIKYIELIKEELSGQCGTCIYLKNIKDKRHISLCMNKNASRYKKPLHRAKFRIACGLYKLREQLVNSTLLDSIEKVKFIEDYRGKHGDEEIWVIGCDPFLDDYPDDFFDNKISIAAGYSFVAFPKCTYIINSHNERIDWILENKPEFLKKCILCMFPFKNEGMSWPDRFGYEPIWMMISNPSTRKRSMGDAEKASWDMAKSIMNGEQITYVAHWSIVQMGILAAIILGAKKVTLAGCSGMAKKFQGHAFRAGMGQFWHPSERDMKERKISFVEAFAGRGGGSYSNEAYIKGEVTGPLQWRRGASLFAEIFSQYGIEICRHWYKKGYEKIEPFSYWTDRG